MSGRIGAARSEWEQYRCCLSPLDDKFGEDEYILPVFNKCDDFAKNNTAGKILISCLSPILMYHGQ